MEFTRITVDPAIMAGVPTVRGLRIPVATVVAMIADGMSTEEILTDLPDLVVCRANGYAVVFYDGA